MVVIPQPPSTSAWQKQKGGGKLPTHSNQSPPGFGNISSIQNPKLSLHLRHWNGDNSNNTLTKLGFELLHAHAQNPFRPARGAISRSNIPLEKSGRRFIFTKQKRPLRNTVKGRVRNHLLLSLWFPYLGCIYPTTKNTALT